MIRSRTHAHRVAAALIKAQCHAGIDSASIAAVRALLLDRRTFVTGSIASVLLTGCGGGGGSDGDGNSNQPPPGGNPPPPPGGGGNPTMSDSHYDVTDYGAVAGDPNNNLATAFGAVFAEINRKDPQTGGCIYIPSGDFYLNSTINITHDFITVMGANYGFESGTGHGGGSRVIVRTDRGFAVPVASGRINGLTFRNFLLDGEAANNARAGIDVQRDSDGLVIEGIAAKEFGDAVVIRNADAAYIVGNLLVENQSCLRLVNDGIACIVANNRLGGKPEGITLFAENHDRLVVSGNNIFPDGYSNLVLKESAHCVIAANQFQSYYTGVLHLEGAGCRNNAVVANTFSCENSPQGVWNVNPSRQFDDQFGILRVEGSSNLITGNHIHSVGGATHAMIRLLGHGNHVSDCILNALIGSSQKVRVDGGTAMLPNVVIDCTTQSEAFFAPTSVRRFRPLPADVTG